MSRFDGENDLPGVLPPFITVEGIDGCGKSTQAALLAEALRTAGIPVTELREPGGTAISEKIRTLLLDPGNSEMGDVCELLLYEAARAQLVHERIAPALAAGSAVVCDRFFDSTTCYQSFAAGIDRAAVDLANQLAVGPCVPRLTIVFDVDVRIAARRALGRGGADRMEAKGLAFQERVARGFRELAREEPERVKVVDASRPIGDVFRDVVDAVARTGLALPDDAVEEVLARLERGES